LFGIGSDKILARPSFYHNLIGKVDFSWCLLVPTYLSYYIHPLKIVKTMASISTILIIFISYAISHVTTPFQLMLVQCLFTCFSIDTAPASPVFLVHLPVFKRFTYSTFLYALSRAIVYFATAFGFLYFTEKFNDFGLLVIMIPVIIGFFYALSHFEKLEKEAGNYY
jgi:MHS family proline/betaine transporter-like MFS transporter